MGTGRKIAAAAVLVIAVVLVAGWLHWSGGSGASNLKRTDWIGVGGSVGEPHYGDIDQIVAIDASTGLYKWHYQVNPNEAWDYKATADLILADLEIDGQPRKVIMQAPTNGFFYVLDRQTGKLISAEKFEKVNWAERIELKTGRPVEVPGIRYEKKPFRIQPGVMGAHNWQAMAYSPRTGLVYIPAQRSSSEFAEIPELVKNPMQRTPESPYKMVASAGHTGGSSADDGTASLLAWDPVAQKERWRVPYPRFWNGGTLATAGDLVFQGDGEGIFHAYDARNGTELWQFDAKLGIVAAPITFAVDGTQYVSVLVGYGGGANVSSTDEVSWGWKYNLQPRRMLTFALNGKARLPQTPGRDPVVRPLDDPAFRIDTQAAARGMMDFGIHCTACHGMATRSPGAPAPDLRESPVANDLQAFTALLQNGGLEPNGMPRFDEISESRANDIFMYIRQQARKAAAK